MQKTTFVLICLFFQLTSCNQSESVEFENENLPVLTDENRPIEIQPVSVPSLVILGTIQDAGSPHIDCQKKCCEDLRKNPDPSRMVVSLGYIDPENKVKFLFEASPDITQQLALLSQHENFSISDIPNGVFLTHAHIGHYTGLMYFGKEATNASNVPVFSMPKMKVFLETNGPWDQLVNNENILIHDLQNAHETVLNQNLKVIPLLVPHRDEYSETVGFKIIGPNKTALFIPDIDKWQKWDLDVLEEIHNADYAFLDATFYSNDEIPNREISEIPHPLVSESMDYFSTLSSEDKSKIYFIHINHSNPILDESAGITDKINSEGFQVARVHDVFEM